MRVLVEFKVDGQSRVERINNLDFLPRVGETISLVKLENASLEVQQVIHGFGPNNDEQIIRLVSKYVPDTE